LLPEVQEAEAAAAAASVPEPVPEVPAAADHAGPVAAAVEPAASAAVEPAASAAVELPDVVAPPVRAAAPPAAPAGPSPSQVLEFPHSLDPPPPPHHSPDRTHIICHLFCFMFVENGHFRSLPYGGGGGDWTKDISNECARAPHPIRNSVQLCGYAIFCYSVVLALGFATLKGRASCKSVVSFVTRDKL
jgi:hypothetical protein